VVEREFGDCEEETADSECAEWAIVDGVRKKRSLSSGEGGEGSGNAGIFMVLKWETGNSVGSVPKFGSDNFVLRNRVLKCANCGGDRQFFWEEGWLAGWVDRTELGSFVGIR
jgi:hypothetical protein